ncbi:MAG: hypothetical protein H7232_19370 [Aeromicrobium sp.]|nr:hypothetical protein [Burkholderiales bacterium]
MNYLDKLTAIQTAAKFLSASEVEELQKWEKKITGKGDIGTSDWPGWGAAIARLEASGLRDSALDIAGLRASLQRRYPDASYQLICGMLACLIEDNKPISIFNEEDGSFSSEQSVTDAAWLSAYAALQKVIAGRHYDECRAQIHLPPNPP